MNKVFFGKTKTGKDVYKYIISNGIIEISVLDFGATLYSLNVPDRNNNLTDIVLMPLDLSDIESSTLYMGATVGRYANRIKNSEFIINKKIYKLSANEGNNCLHGGKEGFDKKLWQASEIPDGIEFYLESSDGDQGFPGNLKTFVRYILNGNNLIIEFNAVSDKDTYLNLTNHSYFNLNGHDSGDVLNHIITVNSEFYIPVDENLLPTGEILTTKNTVFDLSNPKKLTSQYDHCFILKDNSYLKFAGSLRGDISGITMDVYTTKPAMQLYCANSLNASFEGKGGLKYGKNSFVCMETQYYPDSSSNSHFSNALLKKDEIYAHKTIFKFSGAK